MPKQITLETKDVKVLIELLSRGLAYTDAFYRDGEKMSNLFNKVTNQLCEQGGHLLVNGTITFSYGKENFRND